VFVTQNHELRGKVNKLEGELTQSQSIITVLQVKIDELLNENMQLNIDHELVYAHNGRDIISHITQINRFIPDFKPIRDEYAVSQGFSLNHPSIDFSTSSGNNVYAAGAGVAIAVYFHDFLGNVVMIDHLNSYRTLYAHLNNFTISVNDFIDKGQVIGQVGNTGYSTNPHLHFQIIYNNEPIDPNLLMVIHTFQN